MKKNVLISLKNSGRKAAALVLLAGVMAVSMPAAASIQETETEEGAVLSDGTYLMEVSLSGGSGRASVSTPTEVKIENGEITATVVFSSPNYDYMLVDGEKYLTVNTEGNSAFEIPVSALDTEVEVIADTLAMSEPHEIEYTLFFDSSTAEALA